MRIPRRQINGLKIAGFLAAASPVPIGTAALFAAGMASRKMSLAAHII